MARSRPSPVAIEGWLMLWVGPKVSVLRPPIRVLGLLFEFLKSYLSQEGKTYRVVLLGGQ